MIKMRVIGEQPQSDLLACLLTMGTVVFLHQVALWFGEAMEPESR